MGIHSIAIAPYLNVLIVDTSDLFRERLTILLRALDFRKVAATGSASCAVGRLVADRVDLAFIELDDRYLDVWSALATGTGRRTLAVGIGERGLAPAAGYAPDAIIARQIYPSLLRPLLVHLYASRAARRGRVVPLRARLGSGEPPVADPAPPANAPSSDLKHVGLDVAPCAGGHPS